MFFFKKSWGEGKSRVQCLWRASPLMLYSLTCQKLCLMYLRLYYTIQKTQCTILQPTLNSLGRRDTRPKRGSGASHQLSNTKWTHKHSWLVRALKENCENHDIFFCIASVLLEVTFLYENNKKEYEHHLELNKDRGISLCICVSLVGLEVIFHNGHCMLPDGASPDS